MSETYVNGAPAIGIGRFQAGLGRASETALKNTTTRWTIVEPTGQELTLYGGLDGVVDEVRLSISARYPEPFDAPARRRFEIDGDTTLLLHLDGDGAAVGGGGRRPSPAELPKR